MDNSVKTLKSGIIPRDGALLRFSEAEDAWIPTTLNAELASATVIGIYTLPVTDGGSGDVLSTDGNGVLSWITP